MWGLCEIPHKHLTCLQPSVYQAFRPIMWGCEVFLRVNCFSIVVCQSVFVIDHLWACRKLSLRPSFAISERIIRYLWVRYPISLSVLFAFNGCFILYIWMPKRLFVLCSSRLLAVILTFERISFCIFFAHFIELFVSLQNKSISINCFIQNKIK